MDHTITITLDESQERAIQAQLMRTGNTETVDQLIARIAHKIVSGWAQQNRLEFKQRNLPIIEAKVEQLATDPNRDTKLAVLGLRFVNGVLEQIP